MDTHLLLRTLFALLFVPAVSNTASAQQRHHFGLALKGSAYPTVGAHYYPSANAAVRAAAHFASFFDAYVISGAILRRSSHHEGLSTWIGVSAMVNRSMPIYFQDNLTFFPAGQFGLTYQLNERLSVFADLVLSVYLERPWRRADEPALDVRHGGGIGIPPFRVTC